MWRNFDQTNNHSLSMGLKGMKNKIKQTKIKRDRGVWKKKSLRQRERNKKESVTMERNRKFIKRGKKEREWRDSLK